eukprot:GEMP01000763.1.p1 GENE.GEMP01000763.1~~GEMP01000763.1.p1  ORF type:complete len:1420 (+),score=303.17 GEMP01000763.1:231-4490(+)
MTTGDLEKARLLVRSVETKVDEIKAKMETLGGKKGRLQKQALQEEMEGLLKGLHYSIAQKQCRAADAAEAEKNSVKKVNLSSAHMVALEECEEVVRPSRRKSGLTNEEATNVIQEDLDGIFSRLLKVFEGNKGAVHSLGPACRSIPPALLANEVGPKIKKALETKAQMAGALDALEALDFALPLQHELFPTLLGLFHDGKVGKRAIEVAVKIIQNISSHGRVVMLFLMPLLQAVTKPPGGKWKIKVGALEVMEDMVLIMRETCPKQTASALPMIVPVLRDCVTDMRSEVKTRAKQILTAVGKMVTCPEVRSMSEDLIGCLVDSANMKTANDMLNRLANTTFLHHVDAASFALLFPVVSRAMKERAQETQQKGVMIVGASALLIAEPTVVLPPYLPILLPLVKTLLSEPQAVLQREAAKCMGTLSLALPSLRDSDLIPFMLSHLEQTQGSPEISENDRTGAALGLSEVITQIPRFMLVLLPIMGTRALNKKDTFPERRAGAYSLLECLSKNDSIIGQLPLVWPWILRGLIDDSALVRSHSFKAGTAIVHEVGAPNADVLLPTLIDAVLTFTSHNGRDLAMQLFSQLCDRLSELRKFGQDFLTMDAITQRSRMSLCCMIQICRTDVDPAVRRLAALLWKECVQSGQKAKRDILPSLMRALKDLKNSLIPAKVESATRCIAEMEAAGDFEPGQVDEQTAKSVLFAVDDWDNLDKGSHLMRHPSRSSLGSVLPTKLADEEVGWDKLESRAKQAIKMTTLPGWTGPAEEFLHALIVSTTLESNDPDEACAAALDELGDKKLREPLLEIFTKVFANYTGRKSLAAAQNDDNIICKVDDLMLMYGGGHLLLKNTTLELRKGQRYGVVGRNGAGKTTLMNLIANGGVAKMPEHVRVVHVHHEQLLMASDDQCVEFVGKENKACSQVQLEEALVAVQFPKHMWELTINELSGGWRMRLLLASAMIQGADVLLLDEPTNHLDVGAIAWLANYLNALKEAAIMVISHDPHFLDSACTDIIQYSQEKLVYHRGNFTEFKTKLHISEDEADQLLQGNASDVLNSGQLTQQKEVEDGELEEDDQAKVETADRKAKITFPIPGKVQGLTSASKPVMELKNLTFGYSVDKKPVLNSISCRLTMTSRVAILGVNGAGKSTLLNLLCQEIHPAASALGEKGAVVRHRNCRLAYLAQQHTFHLAEFLGCAPFVYIQKRFQYGWDEALQQRLTNPKNEEEAAERAQLAKKHGKYGNEVETLVGRQMRGSELWYEIKWKNLDDAKQNTWENMLKLRDLGVESFALALDARMQAQAAQLDQRPLTQREIIKHLEQFGLTEEMILNRQIGMFSAGQRSKLTLGAAMWIKPHVIALDEPTNYIDMETLDSLAIALNRFKGAVVTISHSKDFVTRVCNEQWLLENGDLTVSKSIDAFEKMESNA